MELVAQVPRQALDTALLRLKPSRGEIDRFRRNLLCLLDHANPHESEEHHKNLLSQFLRDTYYGEDYYINTKGRFDLVLHTGKNAASPVGVIVETKKPGDKSEMPSLGNLNAKGTQELLLYYLRERIGGGNLELKHLVVTDLHEWFVFDAAFFERNFAQDKRLLQQFRDFEERRLADPRTEFFYAQIAAPALKALDGEVKFAHFTLDDYDKALRSPNPKDDQKLADLFKLLSPGHLLKLPFANDANTLDRSFYSELLHLLGLTEIKAGAKKLIQRKAEGERDPGSLLESAIEQLDGLDKIRRLPNSRQYGETRPEQLFAIALELSITWINRILFLKLLEAQLLNHHKGDPGRAFLKPDKIRGFDDLNSLFFLVLAKRPEARSEDMRKQFAHVPYLNSTLFEPTELEQNTLHVSQLRPRALPLSPSTVLKDRNGRRRTGELDALEYLLAFLDAYNFGAESSEDVQEDAKTLINAAVLGLIFEKINGYKDGSFFTPGFITMHMCRETVRRALVAKFNQAKGWKLESFEQLFDRIEDKPEANRIVNSLRICDPAVGSGHFLVSALNEILAAKDELKILLDREGRNLRDYRLEVANDELLVFDDDGRLFEYKPNSPESQRVQEALFHEKQTLIEGCLFGVDINPNSVKICRLRLWIELLKHAYYRPGSDELETLPNIDINIKCGNSLISRYALDADLKAALRKSKWNITTYRDAVMTYRDTRDREVKRSMEELIDKIKNDFVSEVAFNDSRALKLKKLQGELYSLNNQPLLFEKTKAEKAQWEAQVKKLLADIAALERELEDIKHNQIYDNAFEWRFEFPEALGDDGAFVGFDLVISNPPYGVKLNDTAKGLMLSQYHATDDIYTLFMEKGLALSNRQGLMAWISPIFWLTGDRYLATRKLIRDEAHLELGIILPYDIFPGAYVDTGIFVFSKHRNGGVSWTYEFNPKDKINPAVLKALTPLPLQRHEWADRQDCKIVFNPTSRALINKLDNIPTKVGDVTDSIRGILADPKDYSSSERDDSYKPVFVGKIDRYFLEDEGFAYVKYGANLKERPTDFEWFSGERLLARRIVNRQFRVMATLASRQFVVKKDLYIFKVKPKATVSLKYLLAIFNSQLISFIKTRGGSSARKDDFTQLTLSDLRDIGVPAASVEDIAKIETLADGIMAAKRLDPKADTSGKEAEIDQIVYGLYGLTKAEIHVVENPLPPL